MRWFKRKPKCKDCDIKDVQHRIYQGWLCDACSEARKERYRKEAESWRQFQIHEFLERWMDEAWERNR